MPRTVESRLPQPSPSYPRSMPSARRFPPPWMAEENNNACFIVKDATGQALGYFYFEEEPGRRSAAKLAPIAARMLFKSWLSRRPGYVQFL